MLNLLLLPVQVTRKLSIVSDSVQLRYQVCCGINSNDLCLAPSKGSGFPLIYWQKIDKFLLKNLPKNHYVDKYSLELLCLNFAYIAFPENNNPSIFLERYSDFDVISNMKVSYLPINPYLHNNSTVVVDFILGFHGLSLLTYTITDPLNEDFTICHFELKQEGEFKLQIPSNIKNTLTFRPELSVLAT